MQIVAVVPIITNLGAAVLPTILAAVGSIVVLLFRPRELLRVCRQRPVAVGASLATVVLISLGIWWGVSNRQARGAGRNESPATQRIDWAKVAENILAQQRAGRALTVPGQLPPTVQESPTVPVSTVATKTDYARRNFAGGDVPSNLAPYWTFQPEDTMFLATVTFAGNYVFTAGCQSDLGAYTGMLACLEAETGKPVWQVTQLGDDPLKPFFSSPAVTPDGKYVIIGQGLHEDRDCSLLCFEAASGHLHWAIKTPLHIESSPAISGDLVVVGAGAIEGKDGRPTSDPGYVLAVRISDGALLWRVPVNDPESSPAIDSDGIVYIGSGFNGNAVVAIRTNSDEELQRQQLDRVQWRTTVAHPVTGTVTIADDLVVVGAGNSDVVHSNRNAQGLVVAIERKSGQVRWQTPFADGVLGSIAFYEGKLICPIRTGEVAALSPDDGRVLWRSRVSGNAPVIAGCAVADDKAFAVSNDGYLALLNFKDGQVLQRMYLNDQAKPGAGLTLSSPQIAFGKVYVGSETGGLRCLIGAKSAP